MTVGGMHLILTEINFKVKFSAQLCCYPQGINLLKGIRYHLSEETWHKHCDKVFVILKNRWLFHKDCQPRRFC